MSRTRGAKRRMRFSIGAMLVVMAGVAVLLNHEVQRAKAIEKTVKKVEEFRGGVLFRPRANMPSFLAKVLPQYWTEEIDWLDITLYSREWPEPSVSGEEVTIVDPDEFNNLLELGALDNLRIAAMEGTAFSRAAVERFCKLPSMKQCILVDGLLSEAEIDELSKVYPESKFGGYQHTELLMKARKDY